MHIPSDDVSAVQNLNPDQLTTLSNIMDTINNENSNMFFLDDPGGTSKTFLYKEILKPIR